MYLYMLQLISFNAAAKLPTNTATNLYAVSQQLYYPGHAIIPGHTCAGVF